MALRNNDISLYCDKYGVSREDARNDKSRNTPRWAAFMEERAAAKAARKKAAKRPQNAPAPAAGALTPAGQYKALAAAIMRQMEATAEAIAEAQAGQDMSQVRQCAAALKDLATVHDGLTNAQKLAEIRDKQILPISILDEYRQTFYPKLDSGLHELKLGIESTLPGHMRADFLRAWNLNYYHYADAAREAETALCSMPERAALAAAQELKQQKNKARNAT